MGLPRQEEVTAARQSELSLGAPVPPVTPVTPRMREDVPQPQLQLAMAVAATGKCALKFVSSMSS